MAKPGEAMRPKTATYVTHFDPNKLANPTAMSDAKCETFQIYIYIYSPHNISRDCRISLFFVIDQFYNISTWSEKNLEVYVYN